MKKIETEIRINAEPGKVWQVLTDFENHPRWNPFIQSITGDKFTGGRLVVRIQPPGGGGMTFKPAVLVFDNNREFRWKGKLGIRGIFDGEHYFIIEPTGDKQVRFVHGEIFSGLLVTMLAGALEKTRSGFILMNEALKMECEK